MQVKDFPCYWVSKGEDGRIEAKISTVRLDQLPPGEVLLQTAYSSLNYKDALACTGHPGVARQLPHIPGIDAAGTVVESSDARFRPGDEVVITGFDLGETRFGGYAAYVRMPADHVVPLPDGLSLLESMIYGTAGFTAAQSLMALERNEITPDRGPVLVTGASGGVGSFSVALLAKAGFEVVAVSGKPEAQEYLKRLGAARVIGRDAVHDTSTRPLLSTQWASAIDTVGGATLSTVIRSTMHRGVVAVCGLVESAELPLSVYPFLLRGVNLAGIASASCPMPARLDIWRRLAGPWKINFDDLATKVIDLNQLDQYVQQILAGRVTGRVVVRPTVE